MLKDTLDELRNGINSAHSSLKRDLAKIRTGRANPAILDSVRVDYYGSPTPLKQLATIAVPEARLITLKPFEKNQIAAIERAIIDGQLGLNPANDGDFIRVPMPALTEERRRDLVKIAKRCGEDCKVSIRSARHTAKDMIDLLQKDGEVGEDEADRARKELEEVVKEAADQVDAIVSRKEEDILEV